MLTLCHEVQKFISACENIQSLLAQGGSLNSDERDLIELSAIDLLSHVKPEMWTRSFTARLSLETNRDESQFEIVREHRAMK